MRMIFGKHKDGKIYTSREMLDAIEAIAASNTEFVERFGYNISNGLQI